MNPNSNKSMSLWALISGVILLFTGLFVAPTGVIDSSVLIGAGQLLILCATLAGCGEVVEKCIDLINDLRSMRAQQKGGKR